MPFLTHSPDPLNLTMNAKDMVILLRRAKFIQDPEDEDLLIDVLERFMDQGV